MYETAPVGFISENYFINAACLVRTKLSPDELLHVTRTIEKEMGRKTKSVNRAYADRIIDIDILMFDDMVLTSDELILPHPYLHEREFVLLPLSGIATDVIHPVLHKTIAELKTEYLHRNAGSIENL